MATILLRHWYDCCNRTNLPPMDSIGQQFQGVVIVKLNQIQNADGYAQFVKRDLWLAYADIFSARIDQSKQPNKSLIERTKYSVYA